MTTHTVSVSTRAALMGLALVALGSIARAEDNATAKPAEKPVPASVLKKFDKDGDGKLNDEEKAAWKAAREAEKKALLEKYDTNKDGVLSPEEKAKMKADLEKEKHQEKEKEKEKKKHTE